MHKTDIVIARPQPSEQLVLIFHGVGSSSQDLAPLGQALANTHKGAAVVCVQAPYASELGRGHEWFSVMGVTEDNRPERIAQAMPLFFQSVHHWQDVMGIGAERTVLVGFSQGAIMALEASQTAVSLAAKVIAMAGRFAQPARHAVSPDPWRARRRDPAPVVGSGSPATRGTRRRCHARPVARPGSRH